MHGTWPMDATCASAACTCWRTRLAIAPHDILEVIYIAIFRLIHVHYSTVLVFSFRHLEYVYRCDKIFLSCRGPRC